MTRRRTMAARKKARKPAVATSLDKSTAALNAAIREDRKIGRSVKALGGIGAALAAIREFCKNWKNVRPILKKAIAFLKKNGQEQVAAVLEALVRFLDAVAKVCKIIP